MNWLVVLIAAPLASFGEESGNARRRSSDRPTRSALLGLAGAALGVERTDASGQRALTSSFLTATRTFSPGSPLADFHTFQSLPENAGRVATRADALARREDLETSITRRDYRSDGRWQAAYVAREDGAVSLLDLRRAFLTPRFALWVGRKSCPLAHPLAPRIFEADDVEDAFRFHAEAVALKSANSPTLVAVDSRVAPTSRTNAARRHRRLDEPGDRIRWHFSARDEITFRMASTSEAPK
jgi:CRISPR system Cascade subunit CasD